MKEVLCRETRYKNVIVQYAQIYGEKFSLCKAYKKQFFYWKSRKIMISLKIRVYALFSTKYAFTPFIKYERSNPMEQEEPIM